MPDKTFELKEEIDRLQAELKKKREQVADARLHDSIGDIHSLGKVGLKCRKVLRGHLAKIYDFGWDQQSLNIVSASQDGKLIIWDPLTSLKRAAIPLRSSWVMTCAFSPSGNYVACGGLDNTLTVYDTFGNENKPRIKREFTGHQGYISSCIFIDEKNIISASGDATCMMWDIESNTKVSEMIGHSSDVMRICMKPGDTNILSTCSCDRSARIWDLRLKTPCVQMFMTHEDDINHVTFFPNGNAIGTASDDGTCRLYDLTADQEIVAYSFDSNGVRVGCTSCSFSLSGRLWFVGQDNHEVCVKDTLRGETVCKLSDHENRISCLGVAPNGSAVCTGSWDNSIRVYA